MRDEARDVAEAVLSWAGRREYTRRKALGYQRGVSTAGEPATDLR